jgi:thrombospondin motif-containing protein 7/thrombospondin motif-containing protein 12
VDSNDTCCFRKGPRPSEFEFCTDKGPCQRWVPGPWSACSQSCGRGNQVRQLQCLVVDTNAVTSNENCLASAAAAPLAIRECPLQPPCCTSESEPPFCRTIAGTAFCSVAFYMNACCFSCPAT